MEHSQNRHFFSRTREGVQIVMMPAGDRDRIRCFIDQVKRTRALVRDLDEALKKVKLLGQHEEESSQRITELEALCKRMREDAQKLREEKAKLGGMVESHDELIMEFTNTYGYNHSDEDADDEDDDEGGDTATPPAPVPPAATLDVITVNGEDHMEMVPEQEAPEVHVGI
jgi:hypothetical protein